MNTQGIHADNINYKASYYFTTDEQGSIRRVINNSGSVIGMLDYDAFGNLNDGLAGYTTHNTGQGSIGGTDSNWTVYTNVNSTPHAAYIVGNDPAWVDDTEQTQWISNQADRGSSSASIYYYSTSVNLPTGATTLSGMVASDEEVSVYVNGSTTASFSYMGSDEFSDWHAFTLTGLHSGSNSIVFKVTDRGIITGLAVQWGTITI